MHKMLRSCLQFIGLFLIIALLAYQVEGQAFQPTPATFYDHCGRRDKQCFGDTEVCLDYRNCTYAISISENRTHFELITLNNCAQRDDYKPRNFFLGVGLSMFDSQGNRVCREPKFNDFKAFIFWDKVKCPRKTLAHELHWMWPNKANAKSNCEYDIAVNGTGAREVGFNLRDYLSKHIKLSSGDETPYTFADKVDYIVKNDILYINRFAPISEPIDQLIDRVETNTNKPDQQSQERDGNSAVTLYTSNTLVLLSFSLLIVMIRQTL